MTGTEAWVAGLDPDSAELRGRLRPDAHGVRIIEVVVNRPKSDAAACKEGWTALISERRGGLQRQADLWHARELGSRTIVGLRERQRR